MHNFKDLDIWQLSLDLGVKIYEITFVFPKSEIFGLSNQLRRASVSVSSNIAEGSGRSTDKDFRNFLFMSIGSLREIESQLLFSEKLGYFNRSKIENVLGMIDILCAKINGFVKFLENRIKKI